jgi:hypothetical protein
MNVVYCEVFVSYFACVCFCPGFLFCLLTFLFPLITLFFLAATHRWNDPKALSCQDRALPSGTGLQSGLG